MKNLSVNLRKNCKILFEANARILTQKSISESSENFHPLEVKTQSGISLAVQWLTLRASTAGGDMGLGGMGSIPGQGIKISLATRH